MLCVMTFCHEAKAKRMVGIECSKIPQHVIVEWEDLDHLVDNRNVENAHTVKGVCLFLLDDLSCTIRHIGHDYAANKNT